MGPPAARRTERDGRTLTGVAVGGLEVFDLRFPPSFRHGTVDPARGYLAVVLDGAVCKSFAGEQATLSGGSFTSIPAGAAHSSAFGADGCAVLVLRATTPDGERLFGPLLHDRSQARAAASAQLGRQITVELRRRDAYVHLALEGLALELLALAARAVDEQVERTANWLETVRELLHESAPRAPTLQELGDTVGRHPAHVARAFRRDQGVSVTEYARMLRLQWATVAVATTDHPLVRIAQEAGFADQSHFTRSFRRQHGVTPGRYRRLVRS